MKKETIKYLEVKDPEFARFSLLPKIHKRLNNEPGRPVISKCGYYTENISAYLDLHLQLLAQAVKSYIKDTNGILNKLHSLAKLSGNIILRAVDVVGLYQNISHEEGPSALRKRLDNQIEKYISSATLCDKLYLKTIFSNLVKNIKAKKRDCNRNEICTSLLHSVYGKTGRGNSSKNKI